MSWGTLTIGRMELKETYRASTQVDAANGLLTIVLNGMETCPPLALATLRARREDLLSIRRTMQPVTFSAKSDLSGWYTVTDASAQVIDWYATDAAAGFAWTMTLSLIGPSNAVDIESRLTGVARSNAFALAGTRWHAPAIGALGYFTGSTLPGSSVDRVAQEGNVRVWLAVPANVDPRWAIALADYPKGRVRLVQSGVERAGTSVRLDPTGWELYNGLTRVRPAPATSLLSVDTWDSGAWATKLWHVSVNAVNLMPADIAGATLLRNDMEAVTIRLVIPKAAGAAGRTLVDLTLRRGARAVEAFVQTDTSTTLTLHLASAETTTDNSASGYVVATGNDADGNRYVAGSAKAFTAHANGGVSKAATTTLDAFAGVVFNGGTAAAGDAATDIRDQYIGAMTESVLAVLR